MLYWNLFVRFVASTIYFILIWPILKIYKFLKMLWMPIYNIIKNPVNKIIDFINGKKTYFVSFAGLIGMWYAYQNNEINIGQLITNAPILIAAITIRHGMARHAVPVDEGGDKVEVVTNKAKAKTKPNSKK